MVSRVPTFSFKRLKVRPHSVLPVMIGVGVLIVLVISTPWIAFLGLALCYLATIPISILYYRRLAARRDHRRAGRSRGNPAALTRPRRCSTRGCVG